MAEIERFRDLSFSRSHRSKALKIPMMGVLDFANNHLSAATSRNIWSLHFIDLLTEIDRVYGPQPGKEQPPIVLFLNNGPAHTIRLIREALASRAHWLTVEWLPKYAPEMNDIEPVWMAPK